MTQCLLLLAVLCSLSDLDVARTYFTQNEYAEAAKHLEQFFLQNPYDEYPEESLILGKCYFYLKQYAQAGELLESCLLTLREPELKSECLFLLGITEYARFRFDDASTAFREALEVGDSRSAEVLLWLGKSEYKRENYLDAIELLESVRAVRDSPEVSYWLGLGLLRSGQYARADSVFSSLAVEQPWGLRSLLFRGYTLHLMGLEEQAREVFQLISAGPDSAQDSLLAGIAHLQMGSIEMKEKRYQEAIPHLALARETESQEISGNASFRMGWSYYKLGEWEKASQVFQTIIDQPRRSSYWEGASYLLGELEYRKGRYSEALELFDTLLEKAPDSRYTSHSLYASGYCCYHLGLFAASWDRFAKFIEKYPESSLLPFARYRMGLSAYHTGDYAATISSLEPLAIEETPVLGNEAHYLMALSYHALSDHDSSLSELKKLKAAEGTLRPAAQKLLGDVLFEQEDYWRAIEAYKRVSEREDEGEEPEVVDEARYQIQRSLLKLGLYSSPVTVLKVYLRKYPESSKSPGLQMELAHYYLEAGEYHEAIAQFERFLELFDGRPEAADAIMGLAKAHEELGLPEKARETYLEVSEKSPSAPKAWLNAAKISLRLGEFGRAISEYQDVIEKFQGDPHVEQALYMQGECFIHLQAYDEAVLVYEKLAEGHPSSHKKESFGFRVALLALEEGLTEEALTMLDRSWSSDSLKAEALFQTGVILSEMGEYEDAVDRLQEASDLLPAPRKAESLYKAGEILELTGDYSAAYSHYRDALPFASNERFRKKVLGRIEGLQSRLEFEEDE